MATNTRISTIKKVMPAVVSIIISKSLEQIEKEIPPEMLPMLPNGPHGHHLNIPKEAVDAHGMVKVGGGSGFIVHNDGIIVTNRHVVIDPQAEYTVVTNDNKKYKAEILARDPIDDVAIIRIQAKGLPILKLGDSTKMELGQDLLAVGNALGLFKSTVSSGIVSGLSRSIQAAVDPQHFQELRGLIQTDAAINPGNSGGPLINMKGEVIGINTAIVFGAQNLGFAIPINAAKRDLADVKEFGRIRRPLLGLRYLTIDDVLKEKMKLAVDYGAWVVGHKPTTPAIIPNSPAEKAGIKEKDIILECNGKKITTEKTIQDFMEEMTVGQVITFKILRHGRPFETKVTLTERK